jgi:hypothetical protein
MAPLIEVLPAGTARGAAWIASARAMAPAASPTTVQGTTWRWSCRFDHCTRVTAIRRCSPVVAACTTLGLRKASA